MAFHINSDGDIEQLWVYFFVESETKIAKAEKRKTDFALVARERVMLRYPTAEQAKGNFLFELGGGFLGNASKFGDMFADNLTFLTIDTDETKTLHIIPLKTIPDEDVNQPDTFVLLYGKELSYSAHKWIQLSLYGIDHASKGL